MFWAALDESLELKKNHNKKEKRKIRKLQNFRTTLQ